MSFCDFVRKVDGVVDAVVEILSELMESVEPIRRRVEIEVFVARVHGLWVGAGHHPWTQLRTIPFITVGRPVELTELHDEVNQVFVILEVTFVPAANACKSYFEPQNSAPNQSKPKYSSHAA